jgi:hypothetical protein
MYTSLSQPVSGVSPTYSPSPNNRPSSESGIVRIPYDPKGRTAHNYNALLDGLNPFYPQQPERSRSCGTNLIYRTLPPYNEPTPETGGTTYWETTVAGPATIKSLYPESISANYYPPLLASRPIDTLYGHDYSLFHKSGVGKGKRIGYQFKPFPFTDRYVREVRDYADEIIPAPNFMSHVMWPVQTDQTLNSPTQVLPQAYTP